MAATALGWFERVREQGGRLLRVTADAGADGGLEALSLTFDVGTVRVTAQGTALRAEVFADRGGEAGSNADEEDPWWTVLGNPLHRASEHDGGLLLQFRADADSPRILRLDAEDGRVCVRTLV